MAQLIIFSQLTLETHLTSTHVNTLIIEGSRTIDVSIINLTMRSKMTEIDQKLKECSSDTHWSACRVMEFNHRYLSAAFASFHSWAKIQEFSIYEPVWTLAKIFSFSRHQILEGLRRETKEDPKCRGYTAVVDVRERSMSWRRGEHLSCFRRWQFIWKHRWPPPNHLSSCQLRQQLRVKSPNLIPLTQIFRIYISNSNRRQKRDNLTITQA